MTVWRVESQKDTISFGSLKRRKLHKRGCNEPFRGSFWCPRKRWFSSEPCPFINKWECMNYARMCGAV